MITYDIGEHDLVLWVELYSDPRSIVLEMVHFRNCLLNEGPQFIQFNLGNLHIFFQHGVHSLAVFRRPLDP